MSVHHSGARAALLLCALKKGIKGQTDGQAGAQQSPHVTLEDKILYVVLRKIGRVEPPLLPKNRKRLCFLDAWLGAALRRVLGRLFPTKGVFCLAPRVQRDMEEAMGSSALLESISGLIPLNIISSPPSLAGCPPQSSLKGSLFHTAACLPGVLLPAALCLFFAEPSAASSCFQMFPSGSLPCLAPVLRISESKYPYRCLRAAPGSARGPEQHVCTIL